MTTDCASVKLQFGVYNSACQGVYISGHGA